MKNKLIFNNVYIEIHCDRSDTMTQQLAYQIPYVHANRTQTVFKTSLTNIDLVLRLFRGVDVFDPADPFYTTAPISIIKQVERELHRRRATKQLIELGPTNDPGFLMPHQQLGRELAEVNNRFAFFYDTRTGKTPMSLQIVYDDVKKNPHHKWLVLCPLILIENAWIEDATTFFPDLKVQSLWAKLKAKRLKLYEQDANLYVANIESFAAYREQTEALGIYGTIVDESSAMKSAKSTFSKAAVEFSNNCRRWYLLSGTPAPNGEYEYYRQIQSIDYYGIHSSYSKFEEYFFNNVSRNPQYKKLEIKYERKQELLGLLAKYSLYVDKEDVLETPGRDFITVPLKMPADLDAQYHELRKSLALQMSDTRTITAPSEAAKLNKLNQLTSGFIIDSEAKKSNKFLGGNLQEVYVASEYRFDALETLLGEIGDEQAIIWCNYHHEFDIIKKRIGHKSGFVYGEVGIAEKNNAIKAFKNGEIQYLVANPASADKGLTLTNAHIAIYFSMNYSYELYKQSIERIYGGINKQPKRCKYFIFIAEGTIDNVLYSTVSTKGDMSTAVLNYLKGGR